MLMSCEGGDTVRVPNVVPVSGRIRLTSSNNGATVTMTDASDTLIFVQQGPGFYSANVSIPYPDMYAIWYIHVIGPTTITSEMVVGSLSVPCSGTMPVSFQYAG
jgi:hypothetical protein